MALKLRKKIELVDMMLDYYEAEIEGFKEYSDRVTQELIEVFSNRTMEEEIERKLKDGIDEIRSTTLVNQATINKKYNTKISALQDSKNTLELECEDQIKEDCLPLDMIIQGKPQLTERVEGLSPTKQIVPVLSREDLKGYSMTDIQSLLGSGSQVEDILNNLEISDVDLKIIDKEFWFPAGRLELENRDAEDLFRALNIVAVMTVIGLYSNFIVVGLAGMTTYLTIKNRKVLKPLKEYKNFIYSIYEFEDDIRSAIRNYHQSEYEKEIGNYSMEISSLERAREEKLNELEENEERQIRNIKEAFRLQKEEKAEEIQMERDQEINSLSKKISELLKESNLSLGEFNMEILSERKRMENDFQRLNSFSLSIPNSEQDLKLENFHLGVETEHPDVNHFINLPFGSYLFIYKDDKEYMRVLMKYIACQFASRLKGDLLDINLMDPIDYGEGLSDIIDGKSISSYFNSNEVNTKLDGILERFTRDIKNIFIGYDSIVAYNEEKISKGSSPYPYTMNLIQNFNLFEDMDRMKQMLLTRKSGVINMILISESMVEEARKSTSGSDVKLEEFISLWGAFELMFAPTNDGTEIKVASSLEKEYRDSRDRGNDSSDQLSTIKERLDTNIRGLLLDFTEIVDKYGVTPISYNPFNYSGEKDLNMTNKNQFTPILIEPEVFRFLGKEITQNKENAKMKLFFYNDFVQRIITPGQEMKKIPMKGLEMYAGYQDGDVEKLYVLPLDGQTIHYFMGGRTGMGKSNTANTIINTLVRMYSPEDLHIYFMDFKVIEGRKYMVNPTPHFKCISVTSDPYYLESLFDYLIKELTYRQNVLLPSHNAGKLQDIREKGIQVPEIIVFIDEFTEALKASDDIRMKILEASDTLARLGRASGVHLFYTSQDVSDKLDEGTLGQFAGRLSLPVSTASTSKSIIMNASAADAEYQGMGNLLFNNKGGDEGYNVRLKVPIIQPEDMNANFELINDLCKGKHELNCVMFDSDQVRTIEDLERDLSRNKDSLWGAKERHFILGDNAQFDTEDSPVGLTVSNEDSQNFFILSQSKKRRIELMETMVQNFAQVNGKNTILYSLKGNKDYLSRDFVDLYGHLFKAVMELDNVEELVQRIEYSALAVLDRGIKQHGWKFDKEEEFESFMGIQPFIEGWNKHKEMSDIESPINKALSSRLIELLRPHVSEALVLVEGMDEVTGLGIDAWNAEEYAETVKYAPYYGVWNIWSSAVTPRSFPKFEGAFRHRLLGILDSMDYSEYKFMRDTPTTYGGYFNVINPSGAFKYKRYHIDGLQDDVSKDNRIKLNRN